MIFATGELFSDRLALLIAALLLNAAFGGPRALYHALFLHKPGQWVSHLMRNIERKLNRERRTPENRKKRGITLVIGWLTFTTLASFGLMALLRLHYSGGVVEMLLVAALLGLRQCTDSAQAIARQVEAGEVDAAKADLAATAWRNAPLLDVHGVCRASIETMAVQFADRVVAPMFWYLLLGLPGLLVCRSITLIADSTSHVREHFGWAAERMSALAYCVPSVIAAFLMAAASVFLPSSDVPGAFRAFVFHLTDVFYRRRQLAVMAASLGLSLGGGLSVYAPGAWIGAGAAKATPLHARRAALLTWAASFLLLLFLLFTFAKA